MSKQNDAWGIEVGANAIKALRLVRTGSELSVAEFDILPFKKVLTTPDLNVDEAIQVNLDQFLSRHNVAKSTVVLSVPGNMAFARFAKLPPVDPKRIPDIVKFEAVQQIPFPIDQVEWDYQVFAQPDSPDVEVGIFAIQKERVLQFLANYKAVGMTIDGITLSPLAVYNAMAYDLALTPDSPGVIFMDIGTASTDFIIVENGQIWLRTLPIGGNNFTEALVRAFKLSFNKAEKLKREAATSKYARQIFQAMRPVFADLVQEMQRSLGFYQSLNRDAKLSRLIGVGSTFRLPGMQKFLKQQLQMEIERPSGFKRVKVDGKEEAGVSENAMNLVTAYGLALQGLDLQTVNANLLPRHIIRQRLWKEKQPWIGAAAALMLVGAGAASFKLWQEQKAHAAAYADSASAVTPIINDANKLKSEWESVTGSDPRQQVENLRRILDFRDVWPKFMLDLDLAALSLNPQPPLLTSDYDAIHGVPRQQRRRLYIQSIKVNYKFVSDAAAAASNSGPGMGPKPGAGPVQTQSYTYEEMFGGRRTKTPTGPPGAPAGGPPGAPAPQQQQAVSSSMTPPSFEVIITGTTPNAEAVKMIGVNYIKWLKDNADRNDRPYRIVVVESNALDVSPISENELNKDGTTHTTRSQATGGNQPGNPNMNRSGGTSTTASRGSSSTSTEGVLTPPRPEERSLQARDWKFTLKWEIRLIRPEDARQSETADAAPPAAEPDVAAVKKSASLDARATDVVAMKKEVQP